MIVVVGRSSSARAFLAPAVALCLLPSPPPLGPAVTEITAGAAGSVGPVAVADTAPLAPSSSLEPRWGIPAGSGLSDEPLERAAAASPVGEEMISGSLPEPL